VAKHGRHGRHRGPQIDRDQDKRRHNDDPMG
jgi:hypothetical protein